MICSCMFSNMNISWGSFITIWLIIDGHMMNIWYAIICLSTRAQSIQVSSSTVLDTRTLVPKHTINSNCIVLTTYTRYSFCFYLKSVKAVIDHQIRGSNRLLVSFLNFLNKNFWGGERERKERERLQQTNGVESFGSDVGLQKLFHF